MTIELNEKNSRAFCEEVVNITNQYGQFLSEPTAAVTSTFKTNLRQAVLTAVLCVLAVLIGARKGFRAWVILCIAASGIATVLTIIYLQKLRKEVDADMADDRSAFLTLDESGVEFNKEGSEPVRLGWDNVAFVRAFDESVCFFAKDYSGVIIPVPVKNKQEIVNYIRTADADVKVIV